MLKIFLLLSIGLGVVPGTGTKIGSLFSKHSQHNRREIRPQMLNVLCDQCFHVDIFVAARAKDMSRLS